MPSARPARDAARIALDRKHDLAVILEDVLIVLAVETAKPPAADSAAWIAHAQSRLTDAIGACDSLRDAITAAQAQVTKLARQVPVARDSPLRCHVQMIHGNGTEDRCVLGRDHLADDLDHIDSHGCRAPVLVHQSTIEEARRVAEEARDA